MNIGAKYPIKQKAPVVPVLSKTIIVVMTGRESLLFNLVNSGFFNIAMASADRVNLSLVTVL